MNISTRDMDSSVENSSMVHLDAPILPDKSDISNMTIIRTENQSIQTDQMFLSTVAAQALSGIFVWSALLITCHQVSLFLSSHKSHISVRNAASKHNRLGGVVGEIEPCQRTETSSYFYDCYLNCSIRSDTLSYLVIKYFFLSGYCTVALCLKKKMLTS